MCVSYTDKCGRVIEISGNDDVVANHNGELVGEIQFDEYDGRPSLFGMEVNPSYRRAGIATEMMRRAAQLHGPDFHKPSFYATGCDHAPSDTYYTQEGGVFIWSCIKKGILKDTEPREDNLDDPSE